MNAYAFYTKLYGYTHNYRGIPVWVLTPIRRLIRNNATRRLPKYFAKHPADISKTRSINVIVSFTSFPARIGYVYMTVESLLRQTVLPEKIILWLSREQFPTEETVPGRLRQLENEVFQIRYVDGDIKSHKKYYYAFKEFPEKTVITTDDDIVYPPYLIEKLLDVASKYPNCIVANTAKKLSYTNNVLNGYKQWSLGKPFDLVDNVQIGAGGVLYPPNSLFNDCQNLELSQKLAPSVDDLWLNAMARLQGTSIVKTDYNKLLLPVIIPNNQTLTSINVGQSKNDLQLKQIRAYYASTKLGDPYCKISEIEK
jgi:hypothetical protein